MFHSVLISQVQYQAATSHIANERATSLFDQRMLYTRPWQEAQGSSDIFKNVIAKHLDYSMFDQGVKPLFGLYRTEQLVVHDMQVARLDTTTSQLAKVISNHSDSHITLTDRNL